MAKCEKLLKLAVTFSLLLASGCTDDQGFWLTTEKDAGSFAQDTGGKVDSQTPISPSTDAQLVDAFVASDALATQFDAKATDAAASDAQVADAQVADARVADARVADAQVADVRVADVRVIDAHFNDQGFFTTDVGVSAADTSHRTDAATIIDSAVSDTSAGWRDGQSSSDQLIIKNDTKVTDSQAGGGCTVVCDSLIADGCTGNTCTCGGNAACSFGLACVNGSCVCNATSCNTGCCQNNVCQAGTAPSACGGTGGSCNTCSAGENCVAGGCVSCASTCTNGCCSGATCQIPSVANCGISGQACFACDTKISDGCVSGACRCGDNPACGSGLACVNKQCVCNAASCPNGCCKDNVCQIASTSNCGIAGGSCIACDSDYSDSCDGGLCKCGTGASCASGQKCVNGHCVCNATTCPNGCCAGDVCMSASMTTCGISGGTCLACDSLKADSCAGGSCKCGNNPACGDGLACVNGACICNSTSCSLGCCQGNVCQPGTAPAACGTTGGNCSACPTGEQCLNGQCAGCATTCTTGCCNGSTCTARSLSSCGAIGSPCVACNPLRADTCADGTCKCGSGAACVEGQACVSGVCECNIFSCPTGCCDGNVCRISSMTTCGASGNSCVSCNTDLADNCSDGACKCGSNPACATGQKCISGQCVCNSSTCVTGCCNGNVCSQPSLATCGISGQACLACDSLTADTCSDGGCKCGNNPACGTGLACVAGQCVCNALSCPSGCCQGNVCLAGDANNACGTGGGTCANCGTDSQCLLGACAGCSVTCQSGCCNGSTCQTPSLANCGKNGAACQVCDALLADQCTDGTCKCGGGSACVDGQQCIGGQCVCNATSCSNGCCIGATCGVGINCATCKTYHQSCSQNTECCSGNCVNGICQVPASSCKLLNNDCTQNSECCSGHCDLFVDGKKRCSMVNECKAISAACTKASECCSTYCDGAGVCAVGNCKSTGAQCSSSRECCNNNCQGGYCTGTNTCTLLGESCSGSQCCSGQCLGTHCSFANYCRADGESCDGNSDCCNNICNPSTHRCAVTSGACVPTNQPCSGLRSCCNTMCFDVGLGTGIGFCYPIGGCKTYMDVCAKDADCCSLKCGAADSAGIRRCERSSNCLPDGDVCGGQGASQNCCNGGKAVCHTTAVGVSRCFPNYDSGCYSNGHSCSFADQCCSHLCLPDPSSATGFSCGTSCIPLNSGICTTDADCCTGGTCQSGICKSSGQTCAPYGAACQSSNDCCDGYCYNGRCRIPF